MISVILSMQSDQSLLWLHEPSATSGLSKEGQLRILAILGGCIGWSESLLVTQLLLQVLSCAGSFGEENITPCGETGCKPELAATPGEWTEDWSGFICLQSPSVGGCCCREPGSSMLDCVTVPLPSAASPELLACSPVWKIIFRQKQWTLKLTVQTQINMSGQDFCKMQPLPLSVQTDDKLVLFFSYFSQEIGFDTSYNMSKLIFWGIIRKKYLKMSRAVIFTQHVKS